MLTEQFFASIAAHTKPNTGVTKDAGIFFHEFQPLAAQRHVFKKSASPPNCLAVSKEHVFAAQAEKAVVHVYNREKGNQEAIIPFPERVHSLALAAGDTVLLLGTESGRILLWEICSGRLVSTSTSHLQRVTALAVDPDSNYFLSGSTDAMIHVWSLPSILSFSPETSRSPIHTLSTHRGAIASLVCGHSSAAANIAISIAQDKSAIVWDYRNGIALRTYLLPNIPTTLALDPADRAFYVGYEDGSLQTISFFDSVQNSSPTDTLRDSALSHRPIQPPSHTRFNAASQNLGATLSLALSWDGTTLVSGHDSGKIATWDLAKRTYISTLVTHPGPVTDLQFLEPTGFPGAKTQSFKVVTVVKPKHDPVSSVEGSSIVPANYGLSVQFTSQLNIPQIRASEVWEQGKSEFECALNHSSFPAQMLEQSLLELETWGGQQNGASGAPTDDFMSFSSIDKAVESTTQVDSEALKELQRKYDALKKVQKVTFDEMYKLKKDKEWYMKRERARERRKVQKMKGGVAKGKGDLDGDVEMVGDDSGSEVGNTTNEESGSDNEEEQSASSSDEEMEDDEGTSSSSEGED